MSQTATVTVTGYLTADPKLLFTRQTKTPVTHLRLGMTPRRVDRDTGEWRDGASSYFTVNCWRRLALNVTGSLRKGDPVIVRGRLKTRLWQDDGRPRTEVEIEADAIGHDMSFGWSHYMRGLPPKMEQFASTLGGAGGAGELPEAPNQFDAYEEEPGGGDGYGEQVRPAIPVGADANTDADAAFAKLADEFGRAAESEGEGETPAEGVTEAPPGEREPAEALAAPF